MCTFPYCQYERSPSCWCFFTCHVGVVFVLIILRVTEFSKVKKSSAQIMTVLSQGKFKYSITGRNLSGLCDFLHMEGKFVENISVVNGWKVMAVCGRYFYIWHFNLWLFRQRKVKLLKPDCCVKHDWQPVL